MDRQIFSEYNRGYQDALKNIGYNDGATNTQGSVTVLGLNFRTYSSIYAAGYEDGLAYRGSLAVEGTLTGQDYENVLA